MKQALYIIMLALISLVSCDRLGNHPPVIDDIILDPTTNYTPGSDIQVSAVVSDSDGDELEFLWESDGGIVAEPENTSTTWEIFTTAEPYSYEKITLTASDGKESVTRAAIIQMTEGLLMTGYTYYDGTIIPVPGVKLTMGKFSTVSDNLGFYAIGHLKEGYTLVRAEKDGFETYENTVYVDNPRSLFHIPMTSPTKTSQVSGTIQTKDQFTLAGLKVSLLNPDGTDSELFGFTDENGYYEIDHVPHGTRSLLIRNEDPVGHFLNDSLIFEVELGEIIETHDARIKIKRTIINDLHLSEQDIWDFTGDISDGFYLIGKGQQMNLKEFITIPVDAENVMIYLESYLVGGCDMVARLPSHRVWITNVESEYMGGVSWGGEGSNYPAIVSWYPSRTPTFLSISGKQIKLHLELFEENDCVPDPLWRIYRISFSYYY